MRRWLNVVVVRLIVIVKTSALLVVVSSVTVPRLLVNEPPRIKNRSASAVPLAPVVIPVIRVSMDQPSVEVDAFELLNVAPDWERIVPVSPPQRSVTVK